MKIEAIYDMAHNCGDYYEIICIDRDSKDIYIHSNDFTLRIIIDRNSYKGHEIDDVINEIIMSLELLSKATHGCYVYPANTLKNILESAYIITVEQLSDEEAEKLEDMIMWYYIL